MTAILLFIFRDDIPNFYHFANAALFVPAFISIFFMPMLFQIIFEKPIVLIQAFIYIFSFLFAMYIGGLITSLVMERFFNSVFIADIFTFFGGVSVVAVMDSLGDKESA